jgi:uncharacterized glyoxalase superfamily protein PhnB
MAAFVGYVSLFAADPVRLSGFYADLFGFPEIEADRSPIYRSLDADSVRLGFHAQEAYDLLNLGDRRPRDAGVTCYFTIEVGDDARVDSLTRRAQELGATVLKEPYDTYYGAHQSVLADLENNVFRINNARK